MRFQCFSGTWCTRSAIWVSGHRNSKCFFYNGSYLTVPNDRCQNFTISNWMIMRSYFCRLFPKRGKLVLIQAADPFAILPLTIKSSFTDDKVSSPTLPSKPLPPPHAKFTADMLSHVPSSQDQDGEQSTVNQGDPHSDPTAGQIRQHAVNPRKVQESML